jgi:hypothetical protein
VRLDEEPEMMENITCDETWIFQYNVETKQQSMHWKTTALPRMKKSQDVEIKI